MKKVLIFTATYNEAQNIKKLINKLLDVSNKTDILIIDDNSEDKTYDIIKEFYNKNCIIKLIKRKKKLGLDTAHKLGFKFARDNNYVKLVTMDADLSHDPKEIPKFIKYLDKYDFVIGSRYAIKGSCEMNFIRKILSIIANKVIKFILKTNLTEYTSSYRGFNLKNLKNFDLELVRSKGYSFFMDTINILNRSKINMYEFPITFKDRTKGKSKIPKLEIFRTVFRLFLIFM
jgi:dolichol-phosphate mannosyltransferase